MLRKLSSKLKQDRDSRKLVTESGAAVPYRDPSEYSATEEDFPLHYRGSQPSPKDRRRKMFGKKSSDPGKLLIAKEDTKKEVEHVTDNKPSASSQESVTSVQTTTELLTAAERADIETIRKLVRVNHVNINCTDDQGNTALHRAAAAGRVRTIRYLLLRGANLEAKNQKGENALYVAVINNHTSTVGVLLDYMHSVDNRPREPFILLRAKKSKSDAFIPQLVHKASELKPFLKKGAHVLNHLICHAQRSEEMSIFLYSVLDVPVQHTFFMNFQGELNMKNFQKFESKTVSQSITVLNTLVRVVDVTGYFQLRCLIIVSCSTVKLTINELPNLDLLDVRYNKLEYLPEEIGACKKLKTLRCSHNRLRKLPNKITELFETLETLECSYNQLKRLPPKLVCCTQLRSLDCDHNGLIELPHDIGLLTQLEALYVHNNKLSILPMSIVSLKKLQYISFHSNPLLNIPTDFPESVKGVQQYLESLQDDPIANKTVKLVIVGQEGVGKTSLLKALKRTFWMIPHTPDTPKTDGIDVKDIILGDTTMRCFDCGGDVDFNETHNFFITQGALYLACFNLAEYCVSTVERSSFLLGRLQLWLQYIFSKVPSAQVIIIGTHADHPSLTRKLFEEIWQQLRGLLVSARKHHHKYFKGKDRLGDCLLCQSDSKCLRKTDGESGFVNTGFQENTTACETEVASDDRDNFIAFPHIVGYYEVSSVKNTGKVNLKNPIGNTGIERLKDAIIELGKRLISANPDLPRKWANVQASLRCYTELNSENALTSLDEVARLSRAQGVESNSDLTNMLQFLKAQGNVLYFPQLPNLENTVILDPEWLAKIFSSVISYRDTGFDNEGFILRDTLDAIWKSRGFSPEVASNVLTLLRHFGVCIPIDGGRKELFPCKLPIGDPEDSVWPSAPTRGEKQVTYRITFPSIIPPPFFSNLIVAVYKARADVEDKFQTSFYANKIQDWLALDHIGCHDCGLIDETPNGAKVKQIFKVLFEMIPHDRAIQITCRGLTPCCLIPKIKRLVNSVVEQFEGLGAVEMDSILCPGCYMQGSRNIDKFDVAFLRANLRSKEKFVCINAHIHPDAKGILCGTVGESCLPLATIRPKAARDKFDYSGCPRLFIMLPVNKNGISFDRDLKLYASSLVFDGYAVHLLCEFPDGYHLTKTPGYRLKDPKEFMKKYSSHVMDVLSLIGSMSESTVSPQYKNQTGAVARVISSICKEYEQKFGCRKPSASADINLENLNLQTMRRGTTINRDELRKHLHIMDRPDNFGPLRRLKYGACTLWLCNEHYRQMRVVTLGTLISYDVQAYHESKA